jgi:hypothetical protein
VLIDFQGIQAKQDRQRLLLYRIFENRLNVPGGQINDVIESHLREYVWLAEVPPSQHEAKRAMTFSRAECAARKFRAIPHPSPRHIAAAPAIVLWHHWPDERIHQLAEPGDGFQKLCREAAQQLTSELTVSFALITTYWISCETHTDFQCRSPFFARLVPMPTSDPYL